VYFQAYQAAGQMSEFSFKIQNSSLYKGPCSLESFPNKGLII